ncbi:MAG TPA: MmgE/PrpD family protein [bacterium]|jgi:2-methylcitrate dehydratase
MPIVEDLAGFVHHASFDRLSVAARQQIKVHIADALGCAIGAVEGLPVRKIREQIHDFGGNPHCTLIGGGGTAPDLAALYNSALVRYLDFNDSYLAKGETCHPSDNLGAILAAAEYAGSSGKELMTALAVAYQVQCRLSDEAPVRAKGFDHTTQGAYAVAAGVAKALRLDRAKTANAVAISGTALNALRVTRTGALSHWKGLAYPFTCFAGTQAAFLAMRGISGPLEVFEGNKGFQEAIAGPFNLDWSQEDLERITRTIIKRYNAEIHSQSTLEGVLDLLKEHPLDPSDIESVDVETFDVAYNIIGGGEEGSKMEIRTKEEADHSLPYMVAVAILDKRVTPEQYRPARIVQTDVQSLLRKVHVQPVEEFSRRFPSEMVCRVTIHPRDGEPFSLLKEDYEGFHTRPMTWDTVSHKFNSLAAPYAEASLRGDILKAVINLETIRTADLMQLLTRVKIPNGR